MFGVIYCNFLTMHRYLKHLLENYVYKLTIIQIINTCLLDSTYCNSRFETFSVSSILVLFLLVYNGQLNKHAVNYAIRHRVFDLFSLVFLKIHFHLFSKS